MEMMIEVSGFSKKYGDFTAVDDISFTVPPGQIFGLLGPNGAGKTSTLECLEGLRRPDGGVLRVGGVDPAREQRRLRRIIGVQLQSAGMPESITPDEAMRLFCAYHAVAPRYDLLQRLGLGSKRTTQFQALSTGQQRRLALALAVAHEPQVLFLDEPTAGLDVASRVELHAMVRELQANGATIILATHDMAEAEELVDRLAILLNGRLVAMGAPLEITSAGAGMSKVSVRTRDAILLAAGDLGNGHNGTERRMVDSFPAVSQQLQKDAYAIYFSSDVGRTVPALLDYISAGGDQLLDLRVERPSLEDRFLELTTV